MSKHAPHPSLNWRDVVANNRTKVTGRAAQRVGAGQSLAA
jgi:hypothetical protein